MTRTRIQGARILDPLSGRDELGVVDVVDDRIESVGRESAALPDQVIEVIRRYVMFQAGTFMVTGAAEFPKVTEPSMHNEILLKSRFMPMVDVTVTVFGAAGKSWTQPTILVNRDHMLALYLG